MDTQRRTELNTSAETHSPMPRLALVLGVFGVVPFLGGAFITLFGGPTLQGVAQPYLVGYGIAILSFMGGVHWGLAMSWSASNRARSSDYQFGISVIPALAAWNTLLLPAQFQTIWLAVCFLLLLAVDFRLTRLGRAPGWYPSLRWPISLVVVSSLCLTVLPVGDWLHGS